jgi:hypothetical protein
MTYAASGPIFLKARRLISLYPLHADIDIDSSFFTKKQADQEQ